MTEEIAGSPPRAGDEGKRDDGCPFVTVLIPTWNRSDMLAHCLGSLREQQYPKERYEIIVVDDGSTDATAAVVRALRDAVVPEVRYVRIDHAGPNAARNAGIAASRGDPICLVDDDEETPPGWLAAVVAATIRNPKAGCIGGPMLLRFEAPPPRICEMESWRWETHFDLGGEERVVEHVSSGNLAMRRWALDTAGGFEASLPIWGGDDVEWGRRLTAAGIPSVYVPSAWLWHRRTREQLRWTTLLSRRFSQGRKWAGFARYNGERLSLWEQLWPLPFYLLHAVRRRCFGAVMEVARKLGMAWGIVRMRGGR